MWNAHKMEIAGMDVTSGDELVWLEEKIWIQNFFFLQDKRLWLHGMDPTDIYKASNCPNIKRRVKEIGHILKQLLIAKTLSRDDSIGGEIGLNNE